MSVFCRPNGVFGVRLERTKTLCGFIEQHARIQLLAQRRMRLRQRDGDGFGPELRVLRPNLPQQLLRRRGLLVRQTRAGSAQADFGI